jgi:hypothetical protein
MKFGKMAIRYWSCFVNLPGFRLAAQGRTVAEALEIARDVARKLIEARREREGTPNLPNISERRDYTIVVAACTGPPRGVRATVKNVSGDDLHRVMPVPATYAIRLEVAVIDGEDSPRAHRFRLKATALACNGDTLFRGLLGGMMLV